MKKKANPGPKVKTGIFHAPWEKSFDKILTPFEEFIHHQATSGVLLMVWPPRLGKIFFPLSGNVKKGLF